MLEYLKRLIKEVESGDVIIAEIERGERETEPENGFKCYEPDGNITVHFKLNERNQ